MKYICFDVETTGLDTSNDRIVEMCFAEFDPVTFQVVRFLWSMVNPGIPIPPEATAVHGIEDKHVMAQPHFEWFAEAIVDEWARENTVWVAYNAGFDLDILYAELERAGFSDVPLPKHVIDPYQIFMAQHPRDLSTAYKVYTGEELEDAHSATADVDATIKVLEAQMFKVGWPDSLEAAERPDGLRYLDPAKKIAVNEHGQTVFAFGKHKGQPVREHPSYVGWLLSKDFPVLTKRFALDALREGDLGEEE